MSEKINMDLIKEFQMDFLNADSIQDNKLPFVFVDKMYRVRMPSQKEKKQASDLCVRTYTKLVKSEDYLLKVNLIKQLKETQNIDTAKMQEEIDVLEKELIQAYLLLAECKDSEKDLIEQRRSKKNEIEFKRRELIGIRMGYLASAIEYQAEDAYYESLTMCCTEKLVLEEKEGEKIESWHRMWNTKDDYDKDDTNLPTFALGKLNELMLSA